MTVAIDAGNSSLKLAWVEDRRVGPVERIPLDPAPDPIDLAERIASIAFEADAAAGVTLSSVVPAATELVREAAALIGAPVLLAGPATIPMIVRVEHPGLVGTDRLVAAWGAGVAHGTPVVVIDLGTATTVDAVAPDGAFLGGAILPGMDLALTALSRGTARLPSITLAAPRQAIGRDTVAAILSGVVLGHLGAVRELVGRISREVSPDGPRPTVVATGGATGLSWVRDALLLPVDAVTPAIADLVDPELVLRTLGLLAVRHAAAHR